MTVQPTTSSRVGLSILKNQVQGLANELAHNILLAAHSTFVKETWDIGAIIVTPSGEVFGCPHVGAAKRLGMHLGPVLEHAGRGEPGDVFVTNDPLTSGGLALHLLDYFFWTPVVVGDTIVAYVVAFVHVSDVAGIVPGSISPEATELAQEGLRVPPVRLFTAGEIEPSVRDIILANSRVPDQLWGDIKAVLGALRVTERRVGELATSMGAQEFCTATEELIAIAEMRARAIIADVPNGRYTFVDYVDSLPNIDPIRLELALTVAGETIELDFEGSDPEVAAAYNVYTHSQDGNWAICRALSDFFMMRDPAAPWNSGLVRPVKLRAPVGSVLNPRRPVACGARTPTFFRIYYMICGALAAAVDDMPASSPGESGVMLVATVDDETGKQRINVGQVMLGGGGARPGKDGYDCNEPVCAYLRNVPVEILEREMPVRFREYAIAGGTGGAGRFRGGDGARVVMEFLARESTVTVRGLARHQLRAWGIQHGRPGERGTIVVNAGTDRARPLDSVAVLRLDRHETLTIVTAGGGGYGDPYERDAEAVERDVALGLLAPDEALAAYGVVVGDGRVDEAATAKARSQDREPAPFFDFGPERAAFEQRRPRERVS
jgi:N-methylhydantoinase B